CADFADVGKTGNHDGMAIEGLCTNVAIRDCVASGAGDSGFDLKSDNTIVERCKSYGNGQWGIKLWGSGCRIVNVLVYGNTLGGMGCAGNNLKFWNCTFGAGGAEGLRLETPDSAGCLIRNTIFYNAPVVCKAGGVPDENYNCYYGAGAVITSAGGSYSVADVAAHKAPVGGSSIARDPLFVNAAGGDFALQSGGPCIGRGIFDPLVSVDLNGYPRRDPPDMGAISTLAVAADPDAPMKSW
ncbi:MAG: right-handed parallel beta-helix repeat-containing protein, partial [Bacteroidota bacterium]